MYMVYSIIARVVDVQKEVLMYTVKYEVIKTYPHTNKIKFIKDSMFKASSLPNVGDIVGLRAKVNSRHNVSIRCTLRLIGGEL